MKNTKPNIFKLDVENRHATYDFLMNNINNTKIVVYDAFEL